jgi:hypothetical protein
VGGTLTFDPTLALQRSALLLSTTGGAKTVHIAFAGFGDVGEYHGWLMAYDATTLAQLGAYTDTPTAGAVGGGIWQSGQGPAADSAGNVFLATGNGTFTNDVNGSLSDAVIRFNIARPNPWTTKLAAFDFFEPYHGPAWLDPNDLDFGSAGPLLVPDTNLLVVAGKQGVMYLLDRSNLGGYQRGPGGKDAIVGRFQATWKSNCNDLSHVHGSPAFWRGADGSHIYIWGEEDHLKSYRLNGTSVAMEATPSCTSFERGIPESQSGPTAATPVPGAMPGGMLGVSALGSLVGSGVVWGVRPVDGTALQKVPHGVLEAYDANNLATKLWDSGIASEDALGRLARFTPPTVANGKVYMATFASKLDASGVPYAELVVYGAK